MPDRPSRKGVPILSQMLCICAVAVVIVSVAIPCYLFPIFERDLYASKQDEIRTLVEAAHSIVASYHQRFLAGELEEETAKRRALRQVGSIRYGRSGYFWVNDLKPVMLMHPVNPDLNGKRLDRYQDPAGNFIFVTMATLAANQGEGFLPYQWPEPGSLTPVNKLSFIKSFRPWGWVIGTGVYATEVTRAMQQLHLHLMVGTVMTVLLLGTVTVLLANHISRPLRDLARFSKGVGDDLKAMAPVEGSRETRELAMALNGTLARLSTTMVSRDRLDASFSFTRTVLDAIPMGVLIINVEDLTIADVNEWLAQRWGKPRESLIGETCHHNFWGWEREQCSYCPIDDCVASGRMVVTEVEREHEGSLRCFQTVVAPLTIQEGMQQVIHVSQEITARKTTERDLAERNRELAQALESLHAMQCCVIQTEKMAAIGQIAAGVAHEINNPVGFVKSNVSTIERYLEKVGHYLKLLEDSHQEQEMVAGRKRELKVDYVMADIPDLIAESLSGIERIEGIVRNLKSFSRLDSQDMVEADLNSCLDSTISVVWNELKYKTELVRQYQVLPLLTCFPQQLNQVFMNLLVNAAHAIESHGTIRVSTRADGEWVYVSIADTGCGIPASVRERIFEPFFTTKPAGQGTGLGLSISYDIVRKHGGEITVQSEPGQGTEFTVSIPVHREGILSPTEEPVG